MARSRTANKRWKKVHTRRLARRRGYRKLIVGYGGSCRGIVLDKETA